MRMKSVERDETHPHENNALDMDSKRTGRVYAVESDPGVSHRSKLIYILRKWFLQAHL